MDRPRYSPDSHAWDRLAEDLSWGLTVSDFTKGQKPDNRFGWVFLILSLLTAFLYLAIFNQWGL